MPIFLMGSLPIFSWVVCQYFQGSLPPWRMLLFLLWCVCVCCSAWRAGVHAVLALSVLSRLTHETVRRIAYSVDRRSLRVGRRRALCTSEAMEQWIQTGESER